MTADPTPAGADEHPHQPGSDEADPEKQSTPIGVARDLEEKADELGGTTEPSRPPADREGS
jgi:hypothetical protein